MESIFNVCLEKKGADVYNTRFKAGSCSYSTVWKYHIFMFLLNVN